ncbi:bbp13 domain protein [Pseudomonas aeruginosa]|nr:bbp13 domain protein [Pseudomonas aeruginosa]
MASFDDKPGATLSWTAVTGADHYNIYKDKSSGVFGYIGQADTTSFSDINIAPDNDKTVPIGYNHSLVATTHRRRLLPAALVFAASKDQPQPSG